MRVLIVSDIHSNYVALEAVLAAAGPYDQLWNLGDTIGYGPRPNECVAEMRQRGALSIAGNHDLACLGKVDLRDFNPEARAANIWNGERLQPDHYAALAALPPLHAVDERYLLAHGSPREPIWEYLLTRAQAIENFLSPAFTQQICFIGHSHVPLIFRLHPIGADETRVQCDGPSSPDAGVTVPLQPEMRYIINPGSIGQPRNQDPRAAYAVLDTAANSVFFDRVAYDIEKTQRQMREAKLPDSLIIRLQYGM
jgi:predicted phosphodiesterase